jgi:general secretion pathway protein F
VVSGIEYAASADAVRGVLRARGQLTLEVRDTDTANHGSRGPLAPRETALVLRALALVLGASIPLGAAVDVLTPLVPPGFAPRLPELRRRLASGETLPDALEGAMGGLPRAIGGVLRAGDRAGTLAPALAMAAEWTEASVALRAAIVGALAYPAALAGAAGLVVGLLVTVVLPRFTTIIQEMGGAVPPATRALLVAAAAARACAPFVGGMLLVLLMWARRVHASPESRRALHARLLRLPGVGRLRLASASAHVAGVLRGALVARVPVPSALDLAASACDDDEVASRLRRAGVLVTHGLTLSRALDETSAVTATMIRLIGVGEVSGQLAETVQHAALLEAEAVRTTVRRMVGVLQPALVIALGAIVAFVAIALLQAVYGIRPLQ